MPDVRALRVCFEDLDRVVEKWRGREGAGAETFRDEVSDLVHLLGDCWIFTYPYFNEELNGDVMIGSKGNS